MKNFLVLTTMLSIAAFSNLQAQSATNESEMLAFTRDFMTAYNQQDIAALQKMHLKDAIRIDADGKEIKGATEIADYLEAQFIRNNSTLFLKPISINWSDQEHAWVAEGTYEEYGKTNVYDIEIGGACRYANTMIKEGGKWKIAKMVLSPAKHQDPKVAANIKLYTEVWNAIINEQRLDLFNAANFTEDVTMHAEPENVAGIAGLAAYYNNFFIGFSDIKFTINNIFGEGDQLFKHWTFEGTHTGEFFGIPASGNRIHLEGSTVARMSTDGRIAEERDFMDNMALLTQLGVVSSPGNIGVVDGLYQAFAKGDIPSVLAVMDADIVWNEAEGFPYADRNPYNGPEAVLNGVFARIGAEWEYWNLTDIQLHDMSNNMVLATLRYKAKHKKTGKVIDSQTAHLWTLKNGKVVAFQQYTDTRQAAEAVKK